MTDIPIEVASELTILQSERPDGETCDGHEGPCDNAGRWRVQNTLYNDWRSNWVYMCDECAAQNDAYWDERWRDYYAGLL